MPTAITSIPSDINAAVERAIDAGKRLGTVHLDGYKKTVAAAISAGHKTSGQPLEIVRTLVQAETEVAGELTKTYTGMAREVLPV
jgi:hypothetical protein